MSDDSSSYTYGGRSTSPTATPDRFIAVKVDTNGVLFSRVVAGTVAVDSISPASDGLNPTAAVASGSLCYGWDPVRASWDRMQLQGDASDNKGTAGLGHLSTVAHNYALNGTSWDRLRTNSAAVLAGTTQPFAQLAASPGEWSAVHTPAVNTQATATRAAGAAGVRHVCRSITATLATDTAAIGANVLINLRDGVSGAGTILWSARLLINTTVATIAGFPFAGIALTNLNIFGSAATAMTLEFAAAGGANTFETISMSGYSTI